MFIVKNLSKNLGGCPIVQNINFCLKQGEIIALVGPNGAGKTTLMRCLAGVYDLDGGAVSVDDITLEDNREEYLKKLSYVPETGGLYPEMTVYEYLRFMAALKGVDSAERDKQIKRLASELELDSVLAQKCETLSKGYKRRAAVAGAMISNPPMLILDEPTEGLDPQQKQHFRKLLSAYAAAGNIVLISTHIMEEVAAVGDRAVLINKGRLIWNAPADELRKLAPDNDMNTAFRLLTGEK